MGEVRAEESRIEKVSGVEGRSGIGVKDGSRG